MKRRLASTALSLIAATWAATSSAQFTLASAAPVDSSLRFAQLAIPSPYDYQKLGLFCKLDVQLERRFRMPVLFRLGAARQVEEWEGKGPLRSLNLREVPQP